jgi:sensor domain CHASE-containing protein
MGLQDNIFQNFTQRKASLRGKLLKDIELLEAMEDSIQTSPDVTR